MFCYMIHEMSVLVCTPVQDRGISMVKNRLLGMYSCLVSSSLLTTCLCVPFSLYVPFSIAVHIVRNSLTANEGYRYI